MAGRVVRVALAALVLIVVQRSVVTAQPLGTFSWQLAPYCNVVTVAVTQDGGLYTLDGYDNQCGGPVRASVVGVAVPNPNGSITLGFTIVTPPGGAPVHVQTAIDLSSFGGAWSDNQGNAGSFVFTPSGSASGNPRPAAVGARLGPDSVTSANITDGAVGAVDIDVSQVQRRIGSACPAGQLMSGVAENGSPTCEAVASGAGGDITSVSAGPGLTGGGPTGDVELRAIFSGTGSQNAVARADHTHAAGPSASSTRVGDGALVANGPGQFNTALGASALAATAAGGSNTGVGYHALFANTTGDANTALGGQALAANTTGLRNTAAGYGALAFSSGFQSDNTAIGYSAATNGGTRNTALGAGALAVGNGATSDHNTGLGYNALRTADGSSNVAVGAESLEALTAGDNNAALGASALSNLTSGSGNLAVGRSAGLSLTSGSNNVYVGSPGAVSETGVIRIGGAIHTALFAQGIRGVTTGLNNGLAVVIDGAGQLGTVSSSRRTKADIADLDLSVASGLQRLRPVQFRYRQAFADGSTPLQYGLIAEEVQAVLPELVALDDAGEPASVKYHVLPALLVAEVQRLERERAELTRTVEALAHELAAVRALVGTAASPR
jgi:hypothetical protein